MLPEIYEHTTFLIWAFISAVVFSLIAWLFGYYSLPPRVGERRINLLPVFIIFFVYFFIQVILIPAVLLIWIYIKTSSFPHDIGHAFTKHEIGWINLASLVFTIASVIFVSTLFGPKVKNTLWGRFSLWHYIKSGCLGFFTWFLAYPWVVIMTQFVGILLIIWYGYAPHEAQQDVVKQLEELTEYKDIFFTTVFIVVFLVPIAEEILFRGFLQNWLRSFLPLSIAIFITSLIFAFLHFSWQQGITNWQLIPSLFALACYLGYIAERQQTIVASILLHMTVNGVSIGLLFI